MNTGSNVQLTPEVHTRLRRVLSGIKDRCTNTARKSYARYGGRGIKAKLSYDELCGLWLRDKAWGLTRPSIDRIDNNGDYCLENCQFIEVSWNSSKDRPHAKPKDVMRTLIAFEDEEIEIVRQF